MAQSTDTRILVESYIIKYTWEILIELYFLYFSMSLVIDKLYIHKYMDDVQRFMYKDGHLVVTDACTLYWKHLRFGISIR